MSGRLPLLAPADLDAPQRRFYDSLLASEVPWADRAGVQPIEPDGRLLGRFNALLFNPVLGAAQIEVFRADKRTRSLPPRVPLVWVIDPERRSVRVIAVDAPIRWLREGDTLDGRSTIPGFACPVSDLFVGLD